MIPPAACCTFTLMEVMSSPTPAVSAMVTLKWVCQGYSLIWSGWVASPTIV